MFMDVWSRIINGPRARYNIVNSINHIGFVGIVKSCPKKLLHRMDEISFYVDILLGAKHGKKKKTIKVVLLGYQCVRQSKEISVGSVVEIKQGRLTYLEQGFIDTAVVTTSSVSILDESMNAARISPIYVFMYTGVSPNYWTDDACWPSDQNVDMHFSMDHNLKEGGAESLPHELLLARPLAHKLMPYYHTDISRMAFYAEINLCEISSLRTGCLAEHLLMNILELYLIENDSSIIMFREMKHTEKNLKNARFIGQQGERAEFKNSILDNFIINNDKPLVVDP